MSGDHFDRRRRRRWQRACGNGGDGGGEVRVQVGRRTKSDFFLLVWLPPARASVVAAADNKRCSMSVRLAAACAIKVAQA